MGYFLMADSDFVFRYRLSIAIMDLGLICLLCGFLVVFLVEIDDKDDESNTEGVVSIQWKYISMYENSWISHAMDSGYQ